jgi:hypothetical protein
MVLGLWDHMQKERGRAARTITRQSGQGGYPRQEGEQGRNAVSERDDLDDTCGGTGSLNCYCGGDFCACENQGEVPCPGCEDCEGQDELYGDDYAEDE